MPTNLMSHTYIHNIYTANIPKVRSSSILVIACCPSLRLQADHQTHINLSSLNQTKLLKDALSNLFCKSYVTSLLPSTEFFSQGRTDASNQSVAFFVIDKLRHHVSAATISCLPQPKKKSLLLIVPLPILPQARASLHMAPVSNGMDHDLPHHLAKLPARMIITTTVIHNPSIFLFFSFLFRRIYAKVAQLTAKEQLRLPLSHSRR